MNLRRPLAALLIAGTTLFAASPASAAVTPGNPCDVEGWFVNPDEADRAPVRTVDGFVFEGSDLIHHDAPAGLTTKTLSSGAYAATPAPDQPSFFSVEVSGEDGGYGTLRYNRLTQLWNLVTGGAFYENADPDKLVDMPPAKRSHTVVRFGVGYTANPPGTVKTTVSSVSFQGKAYTLTCQAPTQSPSPTPGKTSASPGASASSSSVSPASTTSSPGSSVSPLPSASDSLAPLPVPSDASGSGHLPVTGASLTLLVLGALLAVALGVTAVVAARGRRRTP